MPGVGVGRGCVPRRAGLSGQVHGAEFAGYEDRRRGGGTTARSGCWPAPGRGRGTWGVEHARHEGARAVHQVHGRGHQLVGVVWARGSADGFAGGVEETQEDGTRS